MLYRSSSPITLWKMPVSFLLVGDTAYQIQQNHGAAGFSAVHVI